MVKKEVKEKAAKAEKKVKPIAKVVADKKEVKSEKIVEKVKEAKEAKPAVKKEKVAKKKPSADTGSVDFQVQNFSEKIRVLSLHLKKHPHDFDSRRGLLIMVGKRRRLLNYLKKKDVSSYEKLAATLKLKK